MMYSIRRKNSINYLHYWINEYWGRYK